MSDIVGTTWWLSDHRTRIGRDEGKGKRAHVLAGRGRPLAPVKEGRV